MKRSMNHLLTSVCSIVLGGWVSGCASTDSSVPTEVEQKGVVYDLVESNAGEGEVSEAPSVEHFVMAEEDFLKIPRLEERSRDLLADQLRPVLGHTNGHIYQARDPNWSAADAVLAGDVSSGLVVPPGFEGSQDPEGSLRQAADALIFGSDGRTPVSNTTVAPFNAIVKLRLFRGAEELGSCTGAYVWGRTVLTSAHCIKLRSGELVDRIKFERGRNGASLPFGSIDCRLDDSSSTNDFGWLMYTAWFEGFDPNFDFAVINTDPCHSTPSNFNGYFLNANTGIYINHGYPKTCPGIADANGKFQCGMTGSAAVNGVWLETTAIDGEDGQSGSPYYKFLNGLATNHAVFGGTLEYWDFLKCGFDVCRRNVARRIDGTMHSLIQQGSIDF